MSQRFMRGLLRAQRIAHSSAAIAPTRHRVTIGRLIDASARAPSGSARS
jgi:hypothetical protein